MPIVVGVGIRKTHDIVLADAGQIDLTLGEALLIETENGLEYGEVLERERMIEKTKEVIYRIGRKITPEDQKQIKETQLKSQEAFHTTAQKIEDHELVMKLTCADFTFDRSKLFVYYTAEERVDFRELIKDLGHILKCRIQMVQIGVRDEAKMIGGIGICGRSLCCKSFLREFSPVTLEMAKEQDLSLNTAKISGACERLMCCLAYEHPFYVQALKKAPRVNTEVKTNDGKVKITAVHCLTEQVTVMDADGKSKKIFYTEIIK
ncbi:MAG: regulatory iron-sulfur-containing complex subunit RicT [Elusimicrobiota bacterium]